jgi:hypothetical protein
LIYYNFVENLKGTTTTSAANQGPNIINSSTPALCLLLAQVASFSPRSTCPFDGSGRGRGCSGMDRDDDDDNDIFILNSDSVFHPINDSLTVFTTKKHFNAMNSDVLICVISLRL